LDDPETYDPSQSPHQIIVSINEQKVFLMILLLLKFMLSGFSGNIILEKKMIF
jgi:hypothetical protein